MAFDAFAIGYSGVALVGYMSSLTSVGYTATQYALLTSAMAWSGKSLKGFSGTMVEGLQKTGIGLVPAFGEFYLLAAALGLPAVILLVLMWRLPANRPA
jgi:PAT family beta-lactamase induction signal transducer AmpG